MTITWFVSDVTSLGILKLVSKVPWQRPSGLFLFGRAFISSPQILGLVVMFCGLSLGCFFRHSLKLGLLHVDPVGATGDSLGALSGVGAFFDRDDLVLDLVLEGVFEGVVYPGDPPEVGVLRI